MENEVVCYCDRSGLAYPDVVPGATSWVWREAPEKGTLVVTEYGLRRLLRLASCVHALAAAHIPAMADLYASDVTQEKLVGYMNEASTIWCEATLVMSRLFVDENGRVIAHKDGEVDSRGIPPHERAEKTEDRSQETE